MEATLQLQKPRHIVSLATSSLLVSVDMTVWSATKQDRAISDEVTTAKKASSDSGRFVKHLLASNVEHKRVLNYRQTVYNWMTRKAYDFSGSWKCLPHEALPKFMEEYRYHEAQFNGLVEVFAAKYPTIISDMAFSSSGQGDMFDRNDYPPVDKIKSKFSMTLLTGEIPMGDFRCQIAADLADDLFNNYTKQTNKIIEHIFTKQSEQLVNIMTSLSHCCGADESVDKDNGAVKLKRRKIYDSTVERALELCDTFKSFNLTNNPDLEKARSALQSTLQGVSLDALRESDEVRSRVKDEVDDILSMFRPTVNL